MSHMTDTSLTITNEVIDGIDEFTEGDAADFQGSSSIELPLAWDSIFSEEEETKEISTESISDALVISLSNKGKVDIEYISAITKKSYKEIIDALKGSIFQNPETWGEQYHLGWETAEEYLSGNLMRKWKKARNANERYHGYFKDNLSAIEKALPENVPTRDIYITLGSPWVPTDVIDAFITHMLRLKRPYAGTLHDELTGSWEIPYKGLFRHHVTSTDIYGTQRLEALYILEKTLNMKAIAVTDEVTCCTSATGKKRIINQSETILAIEKQQKMIKEFQKWVWRDKDRKERLEIIFENNFSCVRRRIFDGSFLEFPDLSNTVSLYPYQKNAVARILFTKNTLLAHDVGSGKTYVMIAAGMELRRMGISKKNLYVVPNNLIGQWRNIYKLMYPAAKILTVEPKDFTAQKRDSTLQKMRDDDYDGIIMAYSCFDRIPISQSCYIERLEKEREEIVKRLKNQSKATATLVRKKEKIVKTLSELAIAQDKTANLICFNDLGITRLFVDEAHNYKNVPVETKANNVLGISSSGSQKCRDMLEKVQYIQKNQGGVIMATGTPITNSITDIFVMQKYLQSGELELLDLQSFDSWIGMFSERSTEFEIDVDTSSYRLATRFSKFHNLPELTSLLSSIADFHQVDQTASIPDFDGYKDALIAKTDAFSRYLDEISSRAECVRSGAVNRKDDNMLKITTDGRKAALDIRLVEPMIAFTYQSKVVRCAENVFDIYHKTNDKKSTQLIFCDSSTPKNGFNIYDELKDILISMGIPPEEIAFVHDAESESERSKLFAKVRRGEIRVLIGSTFKLGLGVNVQNKLIAVHHIDVPWSPANMTQREGRILRQGNENSKIFIYRYITEGSFDAYSWQLLETKQRFIVDLLSGSLTQRSGSDIDGTVLNYAEIKALAIGNPLVKERVETANELSRYLSLQKKAVENRLRLEKELSELPSRIARGQEFIEKCKKDIVHYRENYREYEKEERKVIRKLIFDALCANALAEKETSLMLYQGFEIILPSNMMAEKPFVWLQNRGRYYVETGDTELGALVRIDNYLDKLDAHLEKLHNGLEEMFSRQEVIKTELAKKESYADKIEKTKLRLEKLDKKLGVLT